MTKKMQESAQAKGSKVKKLGAGTIGVTTNPVFSAVNIVMILVRSRFNTALLGPTASWLASSALSFGLGTASLLLTIGVRKAVDLNNKREAAALLRSAENVGSVELVMDKVTKLFNDAKAAGVDERGRPKQEVTVQQILDVTTGTGVKPATVFAQYIEDKNSLAYARKRLSHFYKPTDQSV